MTHKEEPQVQDIMQHQLHGIRTDAAVQEAIDVFRDRLASNLAVFKGQSSNIVGMLTMRDVLWRTS